MKIDGTPMVRSENSWRSLSKAPPARDRYQFGPHRKPLRWYSAA
jgi:hypothetical protein